ncbi:ribonuclease HIII [Floccifex sp.]|uniref:ribonuclease HIII n=1 Tax=Floccifex sp. TaxID=2815810 RepID=UPI003EFD28EB
MTKTKTMTKQEIIELKKRCQPYILKESQPSYTYYQIKTQDCTITAYTSGKVVFQGKDVSWLEEEKTNQIFPQAGSDEVGTGDYFGPVVVAACIVEDDAPLKHLSIQDSKQIQDEQIRKLAPVIQSLCPYSICIVDNLKYNQVHEKHNMVDIKCRLHNQVYVNLIHKGYTLPKQIVIDQFVQKNSYYRYLKNEKEVVENIHFETKAENKYLAVACASILARNAFLEYWDKMEQKYQFHFQKGASHLVDECAKHFVQQYGKDELKKVAKLHFKNTEKI